MITYLSYYYNMNKQEGDLDFKPYIKIVEQANVEADSRETNQGSWLYIDLAEGLELQPHFAPDWVFPDRRPFYSWEKVSPKSMSDFIESLDLFGKKVFFEFGGTSHIPFNLRMIALIKANLGGGRVMIPFSGPEEEFPEIASIPFSGRPQGSRLSKRDFPPRVYQVMRKVSSPYESPYKVLSLPKISQDYPVHISAFREHTLASFAVSYSHHPYVAGYGSDHPHYTPSYLAVIHTNTPTHPLGIVLPENG